MAKDIAAEIQKEYGEMSFTNPSIEFSYNKIEITQGLTLFEKIFFGLGISAHIILIIAINFKTWFPGIMLIIILLLLFILNYYRIFDHIAIDFINKEIRIENSISLINSIKKLLKKQTVFPFSEISTFTTSTFSSPSGFNKKPYGLRVGRFLLTERRTYLITSTSDDPPFEIINCRFERDARRLGELLQHYIVGKPRIFD